MACRRGRRPSKAEALPIPRRAARVVLLDPDGRVLLLKMVNPRLGSTWWVTPGGGLEPGESHAEAAARELREEIGLRDLVVGPPLWRNHRYFRQDGRVYAQEEIFHLATTGRFEVDSSGIDRFEKESLAGHRWWSVEDVETTTENVYPRGLAALLRSLVNQGPPADLLEIQG